MDKQTVLKEVGKYLQAALDVYIIAMSSPTASSQAKTELAINLIGVPEFLNEAIATIGELTAETLPILVLEEEAWTG